MAVNINEQAGFDRDRDRERCGDRLAALPEPVRRELLRRIEDNTLELPLLSEVARQVMLEASDEECDVRRLAELIRRDQTMAGHLLRIANSPLYRPRVRIVSLQQAISRLGLKALQQIALIISCETRAFFVKGHEHKVRHLFRHALAAALYAQEIARLRRWNVEEAFLCGLLHDLGRPVLLQALLDLHRAHGLAPDAAALSQAMEALHAQVGSALLRSWSLPVRLAEAVLYHHDPLAAPSCAQLATLVGLSDQLAHLCVGPREVTEEATRQHPTLAPLNLYPDEMDGLLLKLPRVREMSGVLA